jgi:hypothetical protein
MRARGSRCRTPVLVPSTLQIGGGERGPGCLLTPEWRRGRCVRKRRSGAMRRQSRRHALRRRLAFFVAIGGRFRTVLRRALGPTSSMIDSLVCCSGSLFCLILRTGDLHQQNMAFSSFRTISLPQLQSTPAGPRIGCLTHAPRISERCELLRLAQMAEPSSTNANEVINTRTA